VIASPSSSRSNQSHIIPIPSQGKEWAFSALQREFESSSREDEEQKQRETWFDYCDYTVYSRIVDHLLEQRCRLHSDYALSVNAECLCHALRARQSGFEEKGQPKEIDFDGLDSLQNLVGASLHHQSICGHGAEECLDRKGTDMALPQDELDAYESYLDSAFGDSAQGEESSFPYMIFEMDL
jgi:hypothetical protein